MCIQKTHGKSTSVNFDETGTLGIFETAPTLSKSSYEHNNHVIEPGGVYTDCSKDFMRKPLTGLSRCLKSNKSDAGIIDSQFRIRKLTPLECWRLQGWDDEDFYKARAVNSDSQLYKQAGNGVTVNVIEAIANRLSKVA